MGECKGINHLGAIVDLDMSAVISWPAVRLKFKGWRGHAMLGFVTFFLSFLPLSFNHKGVNPDSQTVKSRTL